MKKLLYVLLGIIALLALAIVVVPRLIDWRPRIAAMAREATGRELRIDGDLRISLVPKIEITATGVHFANAPGASEPDMLALDELALDLELLPLLGKRLVVDRLTMRRPVLNLDVDKSGRPNWQFASPAAGPPAAPSPSPSSGSGLAGGLTLGDVAVENGEITYRNATTGQTVAIKSIALNAAMAAVESPLTLKGEMNINNEPVTADLVLDSLGKLSRAQQASVKLAIETKHLQAKFDGSAQQQPLPGLTGTFDLDTPSIGKLFAWLQQPLPPGEPDPGPLKLHAEFAADGGKTALKTATITGASINVKASGAIDESGGRTRVSLDIQSDTLDIDRFLPPPRRSPPAAAPAATAAAAPKSTLADIPDQPFDLARLRRTDADINVSIAGLKVNGIEVGRIAFSSLAKDGVLTSELHELDLYGGTIKGTSKLDASGDALAFNSAIKVDHVAVDKLAQLAGTSAVGGVVSASLETGGQGKSPRAVAESFHGRLALDLGGIKDTAARELSSLKVEVDLPGPGKATSVKLDGVYKTEPIALGATLAPMQELLSRDRFPVKLAVDSKLLTLRYDGTVQRTPVAGLDGAFDVDIPAVAKLAAWAGEPLDPKAPDPGALKLHAVLASEGAKLALKDASLTGKAIKATAEAKIDASAAPLGFDAKVAVQQADLNAYLPAPAPAPMAPAPAAGASTGWSTEPFPLGALGEANGDVTINLAQVRYRDLDIATGEIGAALKNRVLKASVAKLAVTQGTIDGGATLDGSSGMLKLDYHAAIVGVQAGPLLKTFAGSDRLSGTIAFDANGSGSGHNLKELISSLDGSGKFKVTDGAIHGINLAQALRNAGSLGFGSSETEKTDFAELSGSFTIKSGVIDNRDMKMQAPILRLSGAGTVPLPPKTIDYELEAKLVATLEGQGGNEGLNGVPIPIKLTGPWTGISYQVDWNSVFKTMASDPQRLKSLSGNLGKAAKSFGVDVPGDLLSLPRGAPPPGEAQQPQQQPQQPQKKPSPQDLLKGLLGK